MYATRTRRGLAGIVLVMLCSLTSCGDSGGSDDEGGGGSSAGDGGDPGDGVSCNGFEIAPPLDAKDLVGDWNWKRSTLYEDGYDYDSQVRGNLRITSDGRWDGQREMVTGDGSFTYPTAYGPGDWTFDSRSLTLEYDDGSDAETYTGVRVSDQTDGANEPIRALTLEVADDTGCSVFILGRAR